MEPKGFSRVPLSAPISSNNSQWEVVAFNKMGC